MTFDAIKAITVRLLAPDLSIAFDVRWNTAYGERSFWSPMTK